jgi:hypothetical protein
MMDESIHETKHNVWTWLCKEPEMWVSVECVPVNIVQRKP